MGGSIEEFSRCKDKMPLVRLLLQRGTKFPGCWESRRATFSANRSTAERKAMSDIQETTQSQSFPVIEIDRDGRDKQVNVGIGLKNVDGRWSTDDGSPTPEELLVLGAFRILRRWHEEGPPQDILREPGKPLPDPAALNATIPESEWRTGLDGRPEPPWAIYYVVHLADLKTACKFSFANKTTGARIAFARLLDRVEAMQMMRGLGVIPVVKLESRPMKTSYGPKQRPHFEPVDWRDFGPPTPAVPSPESSPLIGKPVEPVSIDEELNDSIPL
jgi:hypothetical protein